MNCKIITAPLAICCSLLIGESVPVDAQPFPPEPRNADPMPQVPAAEKPGILTVSGHGQISVQPDEATVRFGVEAQADTAAGAQSQVNATMKKVLAAVEGIGIGTNHIRTESISLTPVYTSRTSGRETEPMEIAGYRASNLVGVRVRKLEKVGRVLDAAFKEGANRLEGVSYGLAQESKYRLSALRLAVQDAVRKARALAGALDLKLALVRRVNAGAVSVPRDRLMPMALAERAAGSSTPVEPGEITVQASVSLEYEIAPRVHCNSHPAGSGDR